MGILIIGFSIYLLVGIQNKTNTDSITNYATIKITVINENESLIENLHISSRTYPKFKRFPDIGISSDEIMNVKLPFDDIEGAATLTYTDEFGIDHEVVIIGYLMPYNEIDVTIISADENGLIVDLKSK